jgi:DNA polymerase-1
MYVNLDAKALEWICATFLSQDPVAIKEQEDGIDVHTDNQGRFGLPTRLTAKTYLFRLIYGGSAYSYSVDPDFADVSTSEKFWQRIIDATYDKYRGLGRWHSSLMDEVVRTGRIEMVTGRAYSYAAKTNKRGEKVWPRTQILNYPVQGLGADVMAIIRVILANKLQKEQLKTKLVCTVHDSVLLDAPDEEVDEVVSLCYKSFTAFPRQWERLFECKWNVPLKVEVQIGPNWGEMKEVK